MRVSVKVFEVFFKSRSAYCDWRGCTGIGTGCTGHFPCEHIENCNTHRVGKPVQDKSKSKSLNFTFFN